MEEIQETSNSCPACPGELQNLGVLGKLLISRCRDCGLEVSTKVAESSISSSITTEDFNTLRECITCKARYAAVKDSDLCPECSSDFFGKTAANDHTETEITAPVNCDFCNIESQQQVQASYDGRTQAGPWAYMCEDHFKQNGVGLGLGFGQKLIVKDQQ